MILIKFGTCQLAHRIDRSIQCRNMRFHNDASDSSVAVPVLRSYSTRPPDATDMPVIARIVTKCVTIKLAGADGDKVSSFWRNFASVASRGA